MTKIFNKHEEIQTEDQTIPVSFADESEFSKYIFTIGKIELKEDEDMETAKLVFDYQLIDNVDGFAKIIELEENLKSRFENYLGSKIIMMLEESISEQTTVFANGTGESEFVE